MTDQFRKTTIPPATAGRVRYSLLLMAAITPLPHPSGVAADMKCRGRSVQDGDTLAILTREQKQIKITLERTPADRGRGRAMRRGRSM